MKKLLVTLVIGTLLALPLSATAMEKMAGNDMGDVTGQAGVTIAFGGTSTTTVDFSSVAWGDPDGYDTASGAGWLIIDGEGSSGVIIDQVIADGEKLELDIATGEYAINASSTIPAGTTFIAVTLPSISTSITTPDTLNICLGDTASNVTGTLGLLNLGDLDVTQGTPDKLFIYAH